MSAPASSPLQVLQRLLAMQAQDLGQALWSLGLRSGQDLQQVRQALADGSIVRTWPMRGTLHLMPAADARWMLALLGSRALSGQAARRKQLELDEPVLERCQEHLVACLRSGPRPRSELMTELESIGVSTEGQRAYHVLLHLAQKAVICQVGPDRDVFALLDAVIPPESELPREQALAELARRYFSGHGPATEADLAWWSGLPLRDVRLGIEGAREQLEREELDGVVYWSAACEDPPTPTVHLLPAFDELLLGYRDRTAVLDAAHAPLVCPGGNGVFRPTVAVGGRMVATWRVKVTKRAVRFDYEPFTSDFDATLAEEAAARYESFLGRAVDDTRAHDRT